MLATGLSAQLAPPTRLRLASGGIPPNADSPIARNLFPRTFLTPAILATLRAQIGQNAKFRARWQTAVTQFESTEGTWATSPKDPYSNAFAALLAAIRRPGNDLGLSWRSSWQTYRDRIVTSAYGWRRDGTYPPHAIGLARVYDSLFLDLTPDERADISSWVANAAARDKCVTSTHAWYN